MYNWIVADNGNVPQLVVADYKGGHSLYGNSPVEDIGDMLDE